jgi:biopolymer transport protein ExbB
MNAFLFGLHQTSDQPYLKLIMDLEITQWIKAGGPVMYPIILCSLLAFAVILERLVTLRRSRVLPRKIVRSLSEWDGDGALSEEVRRRIARSRSPLAYMLEPILASTSRGEAMLHMVQARAQSVRNRLQQGLHLLELIVGVTPLLGLLGTVLGMVKVFHALSIETSAQGPMLSMGIAQALLTTVAGLAVAIPSLVAHSLFTRKAENLETEIESLALDLLARHEQNENPGQTR